MDFELSDARIKIHCICYEQVTDILDKPRSLGTHNLEGYYDKDPLRTNFEEQIITMISTQSILDNASSNLAIMNDLSSCAI